jgi:Fe-S-cluster containining protein
MSCLRCGKCCDPIIMNYSFDYIRDCAFKELSKDALFLLNDCIKISAADAKILRPEFTGIDEPLNCNFFVCWYFNDENRLCEHPNKPDICLRFPKLPYNYKTDSINNCGYNKSLKNIRSVRLLYNSEDEDFKCLTETIDKDIK